MTNEDARRQAEEAEHRYRAEITNVMNAVIRTCAHILDHHSNGRTWTPRAPNTHHTDLITQARRDILNRLQLTIHQAEAATYAIEAHRQQHQPPHPRRPNE
ncbi:hypothetical protein [Streptomyces marincola]|uniref:hypothetical protein n=1 Tax=Streptomyces marincola TaxID=2878388 RepID=UPI001CF41EB7|nr:hypothetical protein [Streptomyces marincola]UCM88904.1 hypothetical protein LC193_13620 [Streptomyces marincola]